MSCCLFAYGTLEDPRLLQELTGRHFVACEAVLEGYRCALVKGARYPGVILAPGWQTRGTLYCGLEPRDLRRLDRYEGDLYRRRLLPVVDSRGQQQQAMVYTVPVSRRRRLSARGWQRVGEADRGY